MGCFFCSGGAEVEEGFGFGFGFELGFEEAGLVAAGWGTVDRYRDRGNRRSVGARKS